MIPRAALPLAVLSLALVVCLCAVADEGNDILLADFEGNDYGDWKATGDAFGSGPAHGTLPNQQPVTGFLGKGLVNTYRDGDKSTGTLTSPEFTIRRRCVNFLIGGGNHPGKTCLNLMIDGQVVRTATGRNENRMHAASLDVRDLAGKTAHLEIVDAVRGPWGNIGIDDILFSDHPPRAVALAEQEDYGSLALAFLEPGADDFALPTVPLPAGVADVIFPPPRSSTVSDFSTSFISDASKSRRADSPGLSRPERSKNPTPCLYSTTSFTGSSAGSARPPGIRGTSTRTAPPRARSRTPLLRRSASGTSSISSCGATRRSSWRTPAGCSASRPPTR